ncbi:MAG: sterol carrier protein [Thermoproteus sp.]
MSFRYFRPTQDWLEELCAKISGVNKAPPELSIIAVDPPRELDGDGITLYFKFRDNKCIEAKLIQGKFYTKYTLSAKYNDLLKMLEGTLYPFAAVPLGKLKVERGSLGELADYMPLAIEIVEAARDAARRRLSSQTR